MSSSAAALLSLWYKWPAGFTLRDWAGLLLHEATETGISSVLEIGSTTHSSAAALLSLWYKWPAGFTLRDWAGLLLHEATETGISSVLEIGSTTQDSKMLQPSSHVKQKSSKALYGPYGSLGSEDCWSTASNNARILDGHIG